MYGHLLNQTAELSRSDSSTNDYGDNVYTTPETIKCRIEFVNKSMRNESGETIPIVVKLWVNPRTNGPDVGDQITIDNINYRVVGRKSIPRGNGKIGLYEVECSEWRS